MHSRSVAIIYNLVDDWNRVEIAAVVDSVADVEQTLQALGHRPRSFASTGVGSSCTRSKRWKPDVVVTCARVIANGRQGSRASPVFWT